MTLPELEPLLRDELPPLRLPREPDDLPPDEDDEPVRAVPLFVVPLPPIVPLLLLPLPLAVPVPLPPVPPAPPVALPAAVPLPAPPAPAPPAPPPPAPPPPACANVTPEKAMVPAKRPAARTEIFIFMRSPRYQLKL